MNIIEQLEAEQAAKLLAGKTIPPFQPGDTVIVNVKVTEGERTRVQAYEGVCIARNGGGINESFTVRKISYGEGVERVSRFFRRTSNRSSSCGAARSGAPSSIICVTGAASRHVSRKKWNRPPPRPRGRLPRKRPRQPPRQKRPLPPPNKPSKSMLRPKASGVLQVTGAFKIQR